MGEFFVGVHPSHADTTTGLVSWWKFDDGSGTSAVDSAGTNTGTLLNGPTWVSGHVGSGALDFDGADDYINIPSSSSLNNIWDATGTIAFWIKPDSAGELDSGYFVTKSSYWILRAHGSHVAGETGFVFTTSFTNSPSWASVQAGITFNQWHHIVLEYNSSNTSNTPVLYVDGSNVTLGAGAAPTGTRLSDAGQPIQIGNTSGTNRTTDGIIDDFRIYTRGLTTADVLQLYNTGDVVAPVISSIASSTTATTATITWTTDEVSTSTVKYGANSSYGTASTSASSVTSHSITLTGLTQSTTYHFQVESADAAGNVATSSDLTFTTVIPDIIPPIISSVASLTTATTSTITWTTDEVSTSTVNYGLTQSYGNASTSASYVTSHSIILTGLTASTLYHFQVTSGDASYNYATSSDYTFTTDAPPKHYIRTGATGNNSGTDWTNAYPSFASVTWVRGDSYYVAGGVYNENVSITKALSGSSWIYIKKAIEADHGTDTGWSSSYGTAAAEVRGTFVLNNGYIDIDGQTGADNSGYGIKIAHQVFGGPVVDVSGDSHIHFKHMEIVGTGSSAGTIGEGSGSEDGIYANNPSPIDDHQISYCWIHGVNRNGLTYVGVNGSPGLLVEHNRIEDTGLNPDSNLHGQGFQFGISSTQAGVTIRFNKIIDLNGSAMIAFLGATTNSNINIYGNIFWYTSTSTYSSSPGVIWVSDNSTTVDGLYVYNNTFHNIMLAQIANDAPTISNAYARNNIWESSQFTGLSPVLRGVTADHNYYYNNTGTPPIGGTDKAGVSTAFTDSANHDYHLVSGSLAKDAGVDLGSSYNVDFDGNARPQGSAWDIGAYEFSSAINAPTLTTAAPTSVSTSSMALNANISSIGGASITQSGFAYGTASDLSTVIATTSLGSQPGIGDFSGTISSLTPNTLYYFRAYAVNSAGTSTGSILSTTTAAVSAPTVTTQEASSVTATTATGNGNITVTGNINPTARGLVYGTTLAYGATTTESGSFSTGAFTASISSLTCDTLYHLAAYATNSQGTAYGSDQTFTTSACSSTPTPTSIPANGSVGSIGSIGGDNSALMQVNNLLAMGNYTLAQQVANQFGITIPTQYLPDTVTSPSLKGQSFVRTLKAGTASSDVKMLQIFLNSQGFTVAKKGAGSSGHETNYFGPATKAALMKFQLAHKKEILDPQNLKSPTGFFGMYTIKAINMLLK